MSLMVDLDEIGNFSNRVGRFRQVMRLVHMRHAAEAGLDGQ